MTISLQQLETTTIIGIYEHERTTPQKILFDIDITFDGAVAATGDTIEATIDYYKMSEKIASFVEQTKYLLLERLIADVANLILQHPLAKRCTVCATKPEVVSRARAISLSLTTEKAPCN